MADRRLRDLRRLLETVAAPYGASVIIESTRGGHLRSTFAIGARHAFIITSATPSDWRATRKVERDAHHVLRDMTGIQRSA
jgi:hypothetical protein